MIDLNDVLLAMSNIPVDDPIAEIWGRGLQGGYKIIEYTGSLPITIRANGDALLDYRIYGNTENGESVGERTANLFEVESDMLSSLNWDLNSAALGEFFINYKLSDAVTQELKKGRHTCSVFEHFTDSYTPNMLVCGFAPTTTGSLGYEYRILTNDGRKYTRTFDFSKWQNIYLIIGYGNGFITEADKQLKIDELFANWRISIVAGSTAPVNYIPYGYKLPMTVQSENLFDKNATNTENGFVAKAYINAIGNIVDYYSFNVSEYIPIKPNTSYYAQNVSYSSVVYCAICFYTSSYELISGINYSRRTDIPFTTPPNSAYIRMSVRIVSLDIVTLTGGTEPPLEYIPYDKQSVPVYIGENQLGEDEYVSFSEQKIYRDASGTLTPTDPPVPLPKIPTFDGTTIIDYDGEPKPSQMYVKYKGKE